MNLPSDIAAAVVMATAKELAERAAGSLDEVRLLTIREAAEVLRVSETKARALIREYVELGEASKRVSLRTLRQLIEERTIRA